MLCPSHGESVSVSPACPLHQTQTLHAARIEVDDLSHDCPRHRNTPDEHERRITHRQQVHCCIADGLVGLGVEFEGVRVMNKDVLVAAASKDADDVKRSTDQKDPAVSEDQEAAGSGDVFVVRRLVASLVPVE